jgi:hypothetical protein
MASKNLFYADEEDDEVSQSPLKVHAAVHYALIRLKSSRYNRFGLRELYAKL